MSAFVHEVITLVKSLFSAAQDMLKKFLLMLAAAVADGAAAFLATIKAAVSLAVCS